MEKENGAIGKKIGTYCYYLTRSAKWFSLKKDHIVVGMHHLGNDIGCTSRDHAIMDITRRYADCFGTTPDTKYIFTFEKNKP